MHLAVSPYHLTTREPAAVTAFLLGSSVVTMLPASLEGGGRERAERAAAVVPRYLDFMQSWRWTVPLWNAGVIGAELEGEAAASEVRAICNIIAADERFSPLRRLMKPELFETDERYLEAMAADLLKGGPDPSLTVPVAAGMDRFATRHGLAVVRSEPTSVVQRAEERLGTRVFALAIPVLLQASGSRFLLARELLEAELDELRAATGALADLAEAGDSNGHTLEARERVTRAARDYAAAFGAHREALLGGAEEDDEDDVRVVEGMVAITGMFLPADAALTSSISAMRTIAPSLGRAVGGGGEQRMPVLAAESRRVFTLLVRVMGKPKRR
jgi:hypothetical protein